MLSLSKLMAGVFLSVIAGAACTSVERSEPRTAPITAAGERLNINTATEDELAKLPHIGASVARKIVEHRERHGPFRRPEHLMLIDGISDSRFRRIRGLIRTH